MRKLVFIVSMVHLLIALCGFTLFQIFKDTNIFASLFLIALSIFSLCECIIYCLLCFYDAWKEQQEIDRYKTRELPSVRARSRVVNWNKKIERRIIPFPTHHHSNFF